MSTENTDYEKQLDVFFVAVGRAIREWAELEAALSLTLAALLGVDQYRARVIWMSMINLQARLTLLNRLAGAFLGEPQRVNFQELIKRAETLAEVRNLLAHAHGGVDHKTARVGFLRDAKNEALGVDFLAMKWVDLSAVLSLEQDIIALRLDFSKLRKTLPAALHKLPRMHRERSGQKSRSGRHKEQNCGLRPSPFQSPVQLDTLRYPIASSPVSAWAFGPLLTFDPPSK
ncbi:hypothetical protein HUN39_14240 [Methylocystis sp. FS]|uniref:hypothetical protein n=1 Tax=Methylocystis silviterrae TaxID=2743612 RepID=UPI0015840503|nr:hypothetical protein [Methylocystis silviterrae]NUJ81172.1 hypothetical protein [Methylocystis silviterrae]